ncbi:MULTISPECIES: SGNH/GDSL hydrolase family protein [Nocardioides]|uniref:SGNH/GDSL hydrolase family protein n=1 Tax=Nocardioides vastitatis TaxID=2568655 RepID=A0ABW0ZG86_9ACTN|nr:SGNH/GDSL hydrolase family protein [Nocardioides sp.]THJ00311.1 SGNH/GDSL hydrolase family protein [Nocardioides sp.]
MNRVTAPVLLLLAVLLVACSGEVDASGNQAEPVRASERYVALGDSYTSGPRLGARSGPEGCEQTTGNYPHLLAERLGLELVDVSCGGAMTDHLTEHQQLAGTAEVPPQLDALDADTALVTLSVGANDGNVFGDLVIDCVRSGMADPGGTPCTKKAQLDNGRLAQEIAGIADSIEEAVGDILERAPRARVIVVGYPQIVPASGHCDQLPLAAGDYPFAHQVVQDIVQAQQDGARTADAEYVDVWSATEGHDICADDPWIAGIRPQKPAAIFHPYAEHQDVVADLLMAKISGS